MKLLPPSVDVAPQAVDPTQPPAGAAGRSLERRIGGRATPGKPFGRRRVDEVILQETYPAAFVAQAAAASLDESAGLAAPVLVRPGAANPYGGVAPTGLIVKTQA